MIVLTIKTDQPEAEVSIYEGDSELSKIQWTAHRELAKTLHAKIDELLKSQDKTIHSIDGIACYKGPGSFTGLRIGISVANSLANELNISIVGSSAKDWTSDCLAQLKQGKNQQIITPEYGSPAFTTKPKGQQLSF